MRTLLVVLFVCLSFSVSTSQKVETPSPYYTINTGNGLYGLRLGPAQVGKRVQLDSGNPERNGLSFHLPRAFTFEAWIFTSNPANSRYNTIVSRYGPGPFGNLHNRYTDFNLQIQTNGTLSFFMGNGIDSTYGVLIVGPVLKANTWYHVGFSVHTTGNAITPTGATLFVGSQYYAYRPWDLGQRQERRDQPIYLGDFVNQDGDNKYWEGVLDEVRFWAEVRNQDEIQHYANVPVPQFGSGAPLAYYSFNNGAGDAVIDLSPNGFHGFIRTGSANVSYVLSGVKVDVFDTINNTESKLITLPGLSVDGPLGFTYTILSYPADSQGNIIGSLSTPEGVLVQYLPFSLLGNKVIYTAPADLVTNVTFQYQGGVGCCLKEETPTTVHIQIGEPCPYGFCTRCPNGGAQGTCGCLPLPYFNYTLSEIERILFLFEVEKTLNTLDTLEGKIEQLMTAIATYPSAQDLSGLIKEIGEFNTGCLQTFCETFFGLLRGLSQ